MPSWSSLEFLFLYRWYYSIHFITRSLVYYSIHILQNRNENWNFFSYLVLSYILVCDKLLILESKPIKINGVNTLRTTGNVVWFGFWINSLLPTSDWWKHHASPTLPRYRSPQSPLIPNVPSPDSAKSSHSTLKL